MGGLVESMGAPGSSSGAPPSAGANDPTIPPAGATGSGATPASGLPTGGTGKAPRRTGLYVAIAAIIAIALIILGLGLAGVIPGFHLAGSPSNKSNPAPYEEPVTFQETGLPASTSWSVTLGSAKASTTTQIQFSEVNGSYSYTVAAVSGYTPSPASGSVQVQGPTSVTISFHANSTTTPPATKYEVTFSETGLPAATSWSVDLSGSTQSGASTTIPFSEPNGSYTYTVGAVAGYTASPSSGPVTVMGGAVTVSITFAPAPPGTYPVTFTESGLAGGTAWNVTVGGVTLSSAGTTISTTEVNGSYGYSVPAVAGYTASPTSGTVVVNGRPVAVPITFTPVKSSAPGNYTLSIDETGLPNDSSWEGLVFAGSPPYTSTPPVLGAQSEGSSIQFGAPNGSYAWEVSSPVMAPNGTYFYAYSSTGLLTVTGANQTVKVTYSAPIPTATNYTVTVKETGLPAGSTWLAFLGNAVQGAAAGSAITFSLPNGTYYFGSFTSAPNFYPVSSGGFLVEIDGSAVSVSAMFYYGTPVNFTASGIGYGVGWAVTLTPNASFQGYGPGASSTLYLANGTYNYTVDPVIGYTASPSYGTFKVNGVPLQFPLSFTALQNYTVHFTETGLPPGTNWTAAVLEDTDLNVSLSATSSATSVSLNVPDGNFTWVVSAPSGYWGSPATGGLTVNGAGASLSSAFTFLPKEGVLDFFEAEYGYGGHWGLPNGTSWSVTVNGSTTVSSTGVVVALDVPNGTYTYVIHAPAGYSVVPAYGVLTIENASSTSGAEVFLSFYSGPLPTAIRLAPAASGPACGPAGFGIVAEARAVTRR
jgi:hypothetical protein